MTDLETILEYICNDEIDEMIDWMKQQPPLEQLGLMRIIQQLFNETLAENPDSTNRTDVEKFIESIEGYQETLLDQQMASLKLEMARQDIDILTKNMLAVEGVREFLASMVRNDTSDTSQWKMLFDNGILYEKRQGIFNPDNWKARDSGKEFLN